MTPDEVKRVVTDFYAARCANDVERCLAFVTNDMHIRLVGQPDTNPVAREADTPDAVKKVFEEIVGEWQFKKMNIRKMLVDGSTVALHFDLDFVHQPTGKPGSTEIMNVIEVVDGKVSKMTEFHDVEFLAQFAAG